jgi:hypothetical protein
MVFKTSHQIKWRVRECLKDGYMSECPHPGVKIHLEPLQNVVGILLPSYVKERNIGPCKFEFAEIL